MYRGCKLGLYLQNVNKSIKKTILGSKEFYTKYTSLKVYKKYLETSPNMFFYFTNKGWLKEYNSSSFPSLLQIYVVKIQNNGLSLNIHGNFETYREIYYLLTKINSLIR